LTYFLFLACQFFVLLGSTCALGQVTLDGSLGPKGPVLSGTLPDGSSTTYLISSDLGKQGGNNLFHSFQQFNVLTAESATFTGPQNIENIIGRVTGGSASWVDGLLRSTIDGASLFLLNPSGILFGPNASLDVKGSFHLSTADYLRFEDGMTFHSVPASADRLLSMASPAAFGFLNAHPAKIRIEESALEVPEGRALSIIAGDIEMQGGPGGFLYAPGGRIQLVSVASPGEVVSDFSHVSSALHVGSEVLGKIDLAYQSYLDVSGGSGGSVIIRGGRVLLREGSYIGSYTSDGAGKGGSISVESQSLELTDGATIETLASGTTPGGDIVLQAPSMLLDGASVMVGTTGNGRGGDIRLHAGTLQMSSGATLWSSSDAGPGKGGDIRVTASEAVTLSHPGPDGYSGAFMSSTSGSGDAGRIEISSPSITLDAGWIVGMNFDEGRGGPIRIETNHLKMGGDSLVMNVNKGAGAAGDISLRAARAELENSSIMADTLGAGRGGAVIMEVGSLVLSRGSSVSSSALGVGNGGRVTISAGDSVILSGRDGSGNPSRMDSFTIGSGNGGDISISSPLLVLDQGKIVADTIGEGDGGHITLQVGKLLVNNGGSISSSNLGDGASAGNISVHATETVSVSGFNDENSRSILASLTRGSGDAGQIEIEAPSISIHEGVINTSTLGSGKAGNILLESGNFQLTGGGIISSSTLGGSGPGGNIHVHAGESLTISDLESGLYTTSTGEGHGGNIEAQANHLSLSSGSTISAKSTGAGDAGGVRITAFHSFISESSSVDARASQADGGNIVISVPHMVHLKNSTVSASVGGGPGTTGGNITIDPEYLILANSAIVANAHEGKGGNIRIVAGTFLSDPLSRVDASSDLGIDGTVDIRTLFGSLAESITPLRSDFLSIDSLLRDPCAVRLQGGKQSTFAVRGRDGLPVEPGDLLPSPVFRTTEGEAFKTTEGKAFGTTEGKDSR
jgi:filamentous hemagglutinin family protein